MWPGPLCSAAHGSLTEAGGRLPAVINLISRGERKVKWFYSSVSIRRRRNKARRRRKASCFKGKNVFYFIQLLYPFASPLYSPWEFEFAIWSNLFLLHPKTKGKLAILPVFNEETEVLRPRHPLNECNELAPECGPRPRMS